MVATRPSMNWSSGGYRATTINDTELATLRKLCDHRLSSQHKYVAKDRTGRLGRRDRTRLCIVTRPKDAEYVITARRWLVVEIKQLVPKSIPLMSKTDARLGNLADKEIKENMSQIHSRRRLTSRKQYHRSCRNLAFGAKPAKAKEITDDATASS